MLQSPCKCTGNLVPISPIDCPLGVSGSLLKQNRGIVPRGLFLASNENRLLSSAFYGLQSIATTKPTQGYKNPLCSSESDLFDWTR